MKSMFVAVVSLLLVSSTGCSVNLGMRKTENLEEVVLSQEEGRDKILLLTIDGMISLEPHGNFFSKEPSMVDHLREQLERARKDEEIKGVIVRINSPGGTLGATQMIYDELKRFRKDTGNYVLGLYLEIATSGALYLSMASDQIMSYPTALTGNMGVLFISPNFQELGRKVGVEYRVVKTGSKKDMGTPFRSWPPEEQKMLTDLAMGYNEQFKHVVYDNRKTHGMSAEDFAVLTDARVVSAEQALKLHLIDELGNMEQAIANVEKKLGRGKMKVIAYTRHPDEVKTVYSRTGGMSARGASLGPSVLGQSDVGQAATAVTQSLLQAVSAGELPKGFYYLW